MVWKCPPLNLFNWNNLWKWKDNMTTFTTSDREAAAQNEKQDWEKAFEKQFPDLKDNPVARMCFREGYQRGLEDFDRELTRDWEWK